MFYLLETLPGIKARSLLGLTTKSGVLEYFNLRWDEREKTHLSRIKLREALGIHFNDSYVDFLRYIDPSELMLSEAEAIGHGAHGKVYRVNWLRKPSNKFDLRSIESGDVALKISRLSGIHDEAGRAKFFGEVRTRCFISNFIALS
jgi:hypothetical protein